MHFKSMISVALVMSLGLVANAAPVTDVEPAIHGEVAATGLIDDTLWPLAFTKQCNALYAVTVKLDKQIARAKAKRNYSCTAAQLKVINMEAKCSILTIVSSIAWPLALLQQEKLTQRIGAQTDCLEGYNP
ncbi:MAG: hypothetical protein J3R72DRAFT_461999 [Linnemannia gamsii]|nr:MAG: hypothetical protein J3R72DRAFT_461999 [Linnemannia gamsii]